MKNVEIYDPALCCSTGVCGPSPDAALSSFASALKKFDNQVTITRYNLAQEPGAFAQNEIIKCILTKDGPDALPVILINGEVAMKGVYPTEQQLDKLLLTNSPCCADETDCCDESEDCCGDDDDCCSEDDSKQDDACCSGNNCR